MQINFKTVLAILPALSSTAFASCYMGKPAWTELATEEQIFKAFRNSCERMQGHHAAAVSTCDSANGDIMSKDGGSYFLSIEPYKKGEWNLSVDTCLLLAGEVSKPMLLTSHIAGELPRLSLFFVLHITLINHYACMKADCLDTSSIGCVTTAALGISPLVGAHQ
jgi:hypothetical protein